MKKVGVGLALACVLAVAAALAATGGKAQKVALPALQPSVNDYQQVTATETPPTETQCFGVNASSGGRRCFTPGAIYAAYDLNPVYASGTTGKGYTIAVVDSYGSDTMAHDLHVFDQAFGLQPMCGEEGVTCAPGMPTFSTLDLQGSPATKPQGNGNSNGTGIEDKTGWALEVVLDVEWAHAIAPGANILLVHTPTAETYGVQGVPQMIKAEDYIVKNHLADVISQSFGASEASFGSPNAAHAALLNQRYAFEDAKDAGVTVLASSGDFGSTNLNKQGITGKGADVLQFPNVGWPGSDPLVTGVGGTYLCQDPANTSTRTVDSTDPPSTCQANAGSEEIGWIDSGGGFSSIFPRPSYQDMLPPGSTPIPAASRGVPDVAYNASSRTGVLVYVSLPPVGGSGAICADGNPCSSGWYIIGGTSAGSPQWAGLVALADQIAGKRLGFINPALYAIANSTAYASDFYDVTTGNNQIESTVPGYGATPGWDPITGLGTPNAAKLLPDLAARAG